MHYSTHKLLVMFLSASVLNLLLFVAYGTRTNSDVDVATSVSTAARESPKTTPTPDTGSETPVPTPTVLQLGVYLPDTLAVTAAIDNYADLVGAMPAVVMSYQIWGSPVDSPFYAKGMDAVVKRGAVPMISWEPWAGTINDPTYSLASIINGSHDAYITQFAQAAAAWGKPFFLRFAAEMNGNWYAWGQGVNGNTPDQYVGAWRHVHDLFVDAGATNAIWVWCPNIEQPNYRTFDSVYPGDAYVDWVGLDGYNAASVWQTPWMSIAQLFGASYDDLAALTHKPMMIGETASTEVGGDKAQWITSAFLNDIPKYLPRIQLVVWDDHISDTDWRINSSQTSLEAYRYVVRGLTSDGTIH